MTRCCRSREPIQMAVSSSHGSVAGSTKVPTDGVALWIVEDACTVVSTSVEECLL